MRLFRVYTEYWKFLTGKNVHSQINIEIPFHIFRELKCNHMKTSKLLIERVMTRQYWEKRHARDKYRLEQGFSKYLNGSSVSREVPLLLYQIIKLNLLKRQDLTERNAGGCQQKYTISPRKNFSQKCMSCCQIFRSLFHQMPFYGHDIYPFFRKKCDHKMVAVEPSLHAAVTTAVTKHFRLLYRTSNFER